MVSQNIQYALSKYFNKIESILEDFQIKKRSGTPGESYCQKAFLIEILSKQKSDILTFLLFILCHK